MTETDKRQVQFGLFEPDKTLYKELLDRLNLIGKVPLRATEKNLSIKIINDSRTLDIDGAFVGDFGGSAKDMKDIISALRFRYPRACLVGMVDSPKFKVGADYRTLYENLYSNFDWLIAQIISRSNLN